MPLDQVP